MKKFRLLNEALIFCVILLMVGCTQKDVNINEVNDTNKIRVVTTMYASYDFVNQIVGDEVEVTMLLSPGEETHSYDPTPQDIIGIQNCDLFIYNGGENDSWVSGVLSTIEGEVPTIKMMECVDHLYEEVGHGCEDGHDHEVDAEYDEHVWGSPLNAIKIIQVISAKLQEVNPEYTKIYQDRTEQYIKELTHLHEQFETVVEGSIHKCLVFGDRFPLRYFVEEYGLEYLSAFPGCSADSEVDAATLTSIIDTVKMDNIPVVLKIELSNGNIAKTIAEASGADIRTFYVCHNVSKEDFEAGFGYLDMMKSNLEVLKEALY